MSSRIRRWESEDGNVYANQSHTLGVGEEEGRSRN